MTEITCPRCGFKEVAVVKKEVLRGGKINRRKWHCPRCSHNWETTTDSSGNPVPETGK